MLKQFTSSGLRCYLNQAPRISLAPSRFQSTNVASKKCEGFEIESKDQVLWLKFNRPSKFNAISRDMFYHMTDTFEEINNDDSHRVVVLTGTGNFYSSGNDLSNLMNGMAHELGPKVGMTQCSTLLKKFINSIINTEKILIAAVNGPAIGIAVSTLPLFDYVIASDKATFQTPFTSLGQCPEACSSVTFPQIMGPGRANELLLFNMTWDANKAKQSNLVTEVVEHDKLIDHVNEMLHGKQGIIKNSYPHSTKISKSLIRNKNVKQILTDANNKECEDILDLWLGDECADAMKKFFARSKK